MQGLHLRERSLKFRLLNGFEQVVYAVHLESLDGVVVVGRREDDGCVHTNLVENVEAVAVVKFNIHEYQVDIGTRGEPVHRIGDVV